MKRATAAARGCFAFVIFLISQAEIAALQPANGVGNSPAAARQVVGEAIQVPDEAKKQLIEALGGPFVVFHDRVQEELKVSDAQTEKLQFKLVEFLQETMRHFEKMAELKPEEREKEMQQYRRKADEKLSAFLNDALDAKQRERLFQVQLQQAGAFALLGQHELFLPLKITKEQRKQFTTVVQDMHKKIEPLAREAEASGNPAEIRPKVLKLRKEHEAKIEAILTETQKRQWQALLGKRLELGE